MTTYKAYLTVLLAQGPDALEIWRRPATEILDEQEGAEIIPLDYGRIPGATTSRRLDLPEDAKRMIA
jgi:hypothetical protein